MKTEKKNPERKTQDKKKSKKKNHRAKKKKKMTPTRGFAFRLCQTLSAY